MKIRLEFEFEEIGIELEKEPTKKEMKGALTQSLFEICEDWVLRGQEHELDFIS